MILKLKRNCTLRENKIVNVIKYTVIFGGNYIFLFSLSLSLAKKIILAIYVLVKLNFELEINVISHSRNTFRIRSLDKMKTNVAALRRRNERRVI